MNNNVIKNFFTTKEIKYINNFISNEIQTRSITETMYGRHHQKIENDKIYIKSFGLSRLNIYNLNFNNKIKNKIIKNANLMYDDSFNLIDKSLTINYARYSKEYSGNDPELLVHVDSGNFSFIIDYQLNANTEWPIAFNTNIFNLKNNYAVSFYPLTQYHWRPPKKWNNDDYVELLFFEFKTDQTNLVYNDNKQELEYLIQYRNSLGER